MKMKETVKILVAGVGGQGVVFFTDLLVEAAMLAEIPVATSEIHGLTQRGGSVTAGITFGEHTHGFLEKAGVDILVGLEPLEAQRCAAYLHRESTVLIDNNPIYPYAVNAGVQDYPDVEKLVAFLNENIRKVIYINDDLGSMKPAVRNLYVLGKLSEEKTFPIPHQCMEKAIENIVKPSSLELSLQSFKAARKSKVMAENG
jgi:indolepyruvate ferredoxin oxidoreductase, beta subunit